TVRALQLIHLRRRITASRVADSICRLCATGSCRAENRQNEPAAAVLGKTIGGSARRAGAANRSAASFQTEPSGSQARAPDAGSPARAGTAFEPFQRSHAIHAAAGRLSNVAHAV